MSIIVWISVVLLGDTNVTAGETQAQIIESIVQDHKTVTVGRDTDPRRQKKKMIKTLKGNPDQVGYGKECWLRLDNISLMSAGYD